MTVGIGSAAPEFTLHDQYHQTVTLSSFRGKHVLLMFYPFAFSRTCQGELCLVRDDLPRLQNDEVKVLAVSVDTPYSLRVWAEQEGFDFPLLSDFWPHGKAAQDYGVFNERAGAAVRGTFLVDPEGIVRWSIVNGPGQARDHAEYAAVLQRFGIGGTAGLKDAQVTSSATGA